VNIISDARQQAEADPDHTAGARSLGRRSVLGGLAAVPVLYGVGAATPASAAAAASGVDPASAAATARPGGAAESTGDLVRGAERRYNAPLLTAGTRLVMPAGIKAVAVLDYYHRPRTAPVRTAWPNVTAADGTTVDASVVPDRGAPTRIAILSGFTEGWYELRHASGRTDRVTWDARKLPVLWIYGEFGATNEAPFHERFYSLALQPLSRNPYVPCVPYVRDTVAR
jgi:hypothetical protein